MPARHGEDDGDEVPPARLPQHASSPEVGGGNPQQRPSNPPPPPGRHASSGSAMRNSFSREQSQGLISLSSPKHKRRSPPKDLRATASNNNKNNNNNKSGPTMVRKPNADQRQVIENTRNPPISIYSRSNNNPGEPSVGNRAPPKPRIFTQESWREESKERRQASRRPWNHFYQGESTLSTIDDHFVMLSNLDSHEEPNNRQTMSVGDAPVENAPRPRPAAARGSDPSFIHRHMDYFELSELIVKAHTLSTRGAHYTDEDHRQHDLSWDEIREWLQIHSRADIILPYLEEENDLNQNALHLACFKQPPHDVINILLAVLDQSGRMDILHARDHLGRTPLHHACGHSAPPDTLRELAIASRAKLCATDKSGLTPLHLALIGPFKDYPDLVDLLASTGACEVKGTILSVIPLHYAATFGASEETIRVLKERYPGSIREFDAEGRTCLHWALLSCKQAPESAPATIRLLLQFDPSLVNLANGATPDPLVYLLAEVNNNKSVYQNKERQAAVKQCFTLLLDTKYMLNPNEFMLDPATIRELRIVPQWLYLIAISSKKVQRVLDQKMKSRLPSVLLMLDLYVQVMVMISYKWNVEQSLDRRDPRSSQIEDNQKKYTPRPRGEDGAVIPLSDLIFLYIGATYFLLRELVQVISLIRAKSFRVFLKAWVFDPTDWLDMCYITAILVWAAILSQGLITDINDFSNAAALSAGILWIKLFTFLRTISFDFSVFVSGVFYVAGRLVPYMICLVCFLGAFTQIFYTIFFAHPKYGCDSAADLMSREDQLSELQCLGKLETDFPFCHRWDSFLRVYTMFLGEVDDRDFQDSRLATFFFAVFMLLMVIFLANVLIAIVTHYYKTVQDGRGVLVFYTSRLQFVAEVEAIKRFPAFETVIHNPQGPLGSNARDSWDGLSDMMMMRHFTTWKDKLGVEKRKFNPEEEHFWNLLDDGGNAGSKLLRALMQFFAAVGASLIMSCWFVWGLATVGLAWPPQIREWFFSNSNFRRKRTMAEQEHENEKHREEEENNVEAEVQKIKEEFHDSLSENRRQWATHKASIANMKYEIKKEMRRLKLKTQEILEVFDSNFDDKTSASSQY